MKHLGKLLAMTLFFPLAVALPVYAAETSDSLLKALGFPTKAERISSEPEKTASNNPQTAFNQESKDQTRYLAFAEKADEEGRPGDGKIFRTLARAKQFYLDYYVKNIKTAGGTPVAAIEAPIVKDTAENFKSALDSELYKSTQMYPGFLAQAQPEGSKEVSNVFRNAGKVAASHASFLQEFLATYPRKIPVSAYNVCSVCGYFFLEWAEVETCPLCGASKDKFVKMN